jgi:hypothetical protein
VPLRVLAGFLSLASAFVDQRLENVALDGELACVFRAKLGHDHAEAPHLVVPLARTDVRASNDAANREWQRPLVVRRLDHKAAR